MRAMSHRFHGLGKNLLLMVASLTVFIGLVEVTLRVTGIQSTKRTPSPLLAKPYLQNSDIPGLGYELVPGFDDSAHFQDVTINSLGFRGPELDDAKSTFAVIGDSIAFGYGVDDTETLPQRLRDAFVDYNVVNAGTPGYNLLQEALVYEHRVAALRPEALILVFYWNDLNHDKYPPYVDDLGVLRPHGWTPADIECRPLDRGIMNYLPGKCWLDLYSTFYLALKKVINLRYSQQKAASDRQNAQQGALEDPVTPEQIDAYATELDQLISVLPEDLPRLFVIWPDRYIHDVSLPLLMAAAESRGFTVVNLYESIGNDFEVLSWDYTHPNGNALLEASGEVVEALRSIISVN